jgi:hypothetical protein
MTPSPRWRETRRLVRNVGTPFLWRNLTHFHHEKDESVHDDATEQRIEKRIQHATGQLISPGLGHLEGTFNQQEYRSSRLPAEEMPSILKQRKTPAARCFLCSFHVFLIA